METVLLATRPGRGSSQVQADYLVDATLTLEQYKSSVQGGKPVRRNLVLAGRDPVAVDVVGALLLGVNRADLEQVTPAGLLGLGEAEPDEVAVLIPAATGPGQTTVRGVEYGVDDLERLGLVRPCQRYGTDTAKPTQVQQRAQYGQTNRIWILKGSTNMQAAKAVAPVLGEVTSGVSARQRRDRSRGGTGGRRLSISATTSSGQAPSWVRNRSSTTRLSV